VKLKWSGKRTVVTVVLLGAVGLLYVQGADQRREQGRDGAPASSSDSSQCRVTATVDGVNVRSTPALDPTNVIDHLASGEEADADKVVQNGFRKLGEGRWVSVEYAKPVDGRDCG